MDLKRRNPALRKAVVKLNDSFSGEGNAIFRYADGRADPVSVRAQLPRLEFSVAWETWDDFHERFRRMGGIAEEFVEGSFKTSPSVQLRTDPRGEVLPISTHDQVLGGPSGQVFLGCLFPAQDGYRRAITDEALKIGAVLGRRGVVSRFGVDFLAVREHPEDAWTLYALEINLRMGGTTHPFLALQFLTGGRLDPETGLFLSPRG